MHYRGDTVGRSSKRSERSNQTRFDNDFLNFHDFRVMKNEHATSGTRSNTVRLPELTHKMCWTGCRLARKVYRDLGLVLRSSCWVLPSHLASSFLVALHVVTFLEDCFFFIHLPRLHLSLAAGKQGIRTKLLLRNSSLWSPAVKSTKSAYSNGD